MKYEADIIKDIVDSRGHTKTSIHYQSECVEEWVKEVEGAYPKLCDYQPEWLNYSAENKVGVFPYTALTDVTNATVENVVPYAYKSAILRGQTLKNINDYSIITSSNVTIDNDGVITINAQSKYTEVFIKSLENKPSTKYLVKIKVIENTLSGDFNLNAPANGNVIFDNAFKIIKSGYVGEETIIYTTASDLTNAQFTFRSYLSSSVASGSIKYQLSVIEYQDGMENWDIPYFEGMQSVKLPVLTTTNEDGTKTNILTVNEEVELRGIGDVKDELNCLTGEVVERIKEVVLNGSENWAARSGGTSYAYFINNFFDYNNVEGITSSFKFIKGGAMSTQTQESICSATTQTTLSLFTNKDELSTVENLKSCLSQNPVTIQYPIATESIKTVDLSVVDQHGNEREQIKPIEGVMHLSTSGETIKPLFSGEIPVEAITQNLASFIEE